MKCLKEEGGDKRVGQAFASASGSSSCFSDTVFVVLFRTQLRNQLAKYPSCLIRTGGVTTSLTLLYWRWLMVSSVFAGQCARTSYSALPVLSVSLSLSVCLSLPSPLLPFSPSVISLMVSVDVKHLVYFLFSNRSGFHDCPC